MNLFVTGIGTEVGKTVVSAILVNYFKADYWKPIQSGDLNWSDSMKVEEWTEGGVIHAECYRLNHPVSPHQAAKEDGVQINLSAIKQPKTTNKLIVEGAGGLFVPLNQSEFMIDLIAQLNMPVVLVAKDYLGCINHTILSIKALQQKQIPIGYFVLNGTFNPDTKKILLQQLPQETQIIEVPNFELTNENLKKNSKQLTIK